jgi:hypothetical protein
MLIIYIFTKSRILTFKIGYKKSTVALKES